jgi:hypothetical protein
VVVEEEEEEEEEEEQEEKKTQDTRVINALKDVMSNICQGPTMGGARPRRRGPSSAAAAMHRDRPRRPRVGPDVAPLTDLSQ